MRRSIYRGLSGLMAFLLFSVLCSSSLYAGKTLVKWQGWDNNVFERAKQQKRHVILGLEAVWCHWCHVMDKKTYSNPKVSDFINSNFIPVRVDQDARPDLAMRYRRYAWPATIIFTPDGKEIVKRAGYIGPDEMMKILKRVHNKRYDKDKLANDFDHIKFVKSPALSEKMRTRLIKRHQESFDTKLGGLAINQKFLDRDSVEYSMYLASIGNEKEKARSIKTLSAAIALIDPVWGGVYQYSTHGDWKHLHYEKLTTMQGEYLRIYALAYKQYRKPEYLRAAKDIHRYLNNFMRSPEGGYYTSQDADVVQGKHSDSYFTLNDKQRRKQGIPRIDKNIYTRENGKVIEGLVQLYLATKDKQYLQQALTAARWIVKNRAAKNGLFTHGAKDEAGPYLNDNVAIGRAFLMLHKATGKKLWLQRATRIGYQINARFTRPLPGFTSAPVSGQAIKPVPHIDENISAVRFLAWLNHYNGNKNFVKIAEHGMRFLATPQVNTRRLTEPGVLIAEQEIREKPVFEIK